MLMFHIFKTKENNINKDGEILKMEYKQKQMNFLVFQINNIMTEEMKKP